MRGAWRMAAIAAAGVWAVGAARADVPVDPASLAPGHQLRLVGLDPTLVPVGVWQTDHLSVGYGRIEIEAPAEDAPWAGYDVLDPLSFDRPHRLCVLPRSWLVDGPALGALGPRMVRGASVVSGDYVHGPGPVASLLRVFEADEVACTEEILEGPPGSAAFAERHVAGVEDVLRPTIEGRTLRLELVETVYRLEGGAGVTAPAVAGARGPLPPASACGCAARRPTPLPAFVVLALAIVLVRAARRRL